MDKAVAAAPLVTKNLRREKPGAAGRFTNLVVGELLDFMTDVGYLPSRRSFANASCGTSKPLPSGVPISTMYHSVADAVSHK